MIHQYENSTVHLADCMDIMRGIPDGYYSLAICDPPYGIGHSLLSGDKRGSKFVRNERHVDWDIAPTDEYWKELFRISVDQIIWGANYFFNHLKNTRCVLTWDKKQEFSGADFELAWTSFDKPSKTFRLSRVESHGGGTIHPTQKSIKLYDWIYQNYLPQGGKVFDSHLGSQSNRISAYKRGNIIFDSCELDHDYFNDGNARFMDFVKKYQPAHLEPVTATGQVKIF